MDIVERLRKPVDDIFFGEVVEPIKWEAADEIERLREEHHDVRILNEQYFNENEILLDEIERLREALRTIAMSHLEKDDRNSGWGYCISIARSALQQKDSE